MSGGKGRRAPPKPERPYVPGQLLDWTGPGHWGWEPLPCRYCQIPTQMRDSHGSAAHKLCAEEALTRQAAEAADAYKQNGQQPS